MHKRIPLSRPLTRAARGCSPREGRATKSPAFIGTLHTFNGVGSRIWVMSVGAQSRFVVLDSQEGQDSPIADGFSYVPCMTVSRIRGDWDSEVDQPPGDDKTICQAKLRSEPRSTAVLGGVPVTALASCYTPKIAILQYLFSLWRPARRCVKQLYRAGGTMTGISCLSHCKPPKSGASRKPNGARNKSGYKLERNAAEACAMRVYRPFVGTT